MQAVKKPGNVIVIGGPTASGKSKLALDIAQDTDGVVINADSLQLYNGLPTLTAQPSLADLSTVPHRLYACLSPNDPCTAARWRDMALAEIDSAHAAGKTSVIVGGTGFYIRALLSGLSPMPEVPADIRQDMIARQAEQGQEAFYAELISLDPRVIGKIDPANPQRVIRAREVFEATGQSIIDWQELPPDLPPAHVRFLTVFLNPPRDILYAACDARYDKMLENGAADEARAFRHKYPQDVPLKKALGYAEICAMDDGLITPDIARDKAQQATRNYAKRQVTWFKGQMQADVTLDSPDAQAILKHLS